MGAKESIRGYLVQTLCCLLESIRSDNEWLSVTLEPELDDEKIDILWRYAGHDKLVQVKSSQNPIRESDVVKYARQLIGRYPSAQCELKLFGPCATVSISRVVHGVTVAPPQPLHLEGMVEQAAQRLDAYFEIQQIATVPPLVREQMVLALAAKLEIFSASGRTISREELNGLLSAWALDFYPRVIDAVKREIEARAGFKSLFGFEEKPDLRAALWEFYEKTSYEFSPATIKGARSHLTLDKHGRLAVTFPVHTLIGSAFAFITAAFFFLFTCLLAYPRDNPHTVQQALILTLLFSVSAAATLFMLSLAMPVVRAWRIKKAINCFTAAEG